MKKFSNKITILLFLLLITLVAVSFVACRQSEESDTSVTESYEINYLDSYGGVYSYGSKKQFVKKGEDSTEVCVQALEGFYFVEWSDGIKTPSRFETNVQSNLNLIPIFKEITLTLKYEATFGGHIAGEVEQKITYGNDSLTVIAVPDENHLFAGWSDGVMSEIRQDKMVKNSSEVTARFVSKSKVLNYQYNIPSVYPKQVTIKHGDLSSTKFYIPKRAGYIFDGWYLDPEYTIKITDANGYYFNGNSIFYKEGSTLYPKWITERNQTFKLLLVFIEKVDAQLPTKENELIDIDYDMALVERKICELIPNQISGYLNDWFDGSVVFEVDTFFTTQPIKSEYYDSIEPGWNPPVPSPSNSHNISANFIPEVAPVVKDYRSVITTGSMNDFDHKLHNFAGIANEKYAYVALEEISHVLQIGYTIQDFIDLKPLVWKNIIDTYLHEFAHTVEIATNSYEYHEVVKYYWLKIDTYETTKLYLLNQANIDGEIVGIPMDFWIGNINVYAVYSPTFYGGSDNGKIISLDENEELLLGSYTKILPFGSELTVQAIPYEGWRFVRWSDGITTDIRHDINITSLLRVFAIFEKSN